MPRLPIEIITYILDFVDLRSTYRFTQALPSNALDAYLVARLKSTYDESMKLISNINYKISAEDPLHSFRNACEYKYYYVYEIVLEDGRDYNYGLKITNCKLSIEGMKEGKYFKDRVINRTILNSTLNKDKNCYSNITLISMHNDRSCVILGYNHNGVIY